MYRSFLLFLALYSMTACSNKKETFCVTYKVSITTNRPYRALVAYRDSNDYVKFYTDKDWSMDVCMPKSHPASLLVILHPDLDTNFFINEDYLFLESPKNVVEGEIIYNGEAIRDDSDCLVSLTFVAPR